VTNNSGNYGIVEGEIENISSAEAVANCTKARHTFILKSDDNFIDRRAGFGRAMVAQPLGKIKRVSWVKSVWWDRVSVDNIGNNGPEPVSGKVISKKLLAQRHSSEMGHEDYIVSILGH